MSEFILPTFRTKDFLLDDLVPAHVDAMPESARCPESTYALANVVRGYEPYLRLLAVDIPDLNMAYQLLQGRVVQQIPIVRAYGESEAVYLVSHNQTIKLIYSGLKKVMSFRIPE